MSQMFELIPLVGFFIAYKMYDIYVAVAVLAALMTVGLIVTKMQKKPITNMQWISWVLVLIFGGITLIFRNELFIKWKPTVLNWGFGLAFLISEFVGKKNLTERLLSAAKIDAPKSVWTKLNLSWVLFFIISGGLNIYVAYRFSTDTWVSFKLFGLFGLTIVFAVIQAFFIGRYLRKR